jgi:hypothetical protein
MNGAAVEHTRSQHFGLRILESPLMVAVLLAWLVIGAHLSGWFPEFRQQVRTEPGWRAFQERYRVHDFGGDGYFARAAQNGYNVFHFTPRYAARFTRKTGRDPVHACAGCHAPEDMAYGLVNADRHDAPLNRRVSFEERIMRCFAQRMDGFIPTLYDPTIRDLRIFARAVAHHLQLSEGAVRQDRPEAKPSASR